MTAIDDVVATLERSSAALHFAAAVFLVGFAASLGAMGAGIVQTNDLAGVFGGVGFTLGFLGLLGLYPRVSSGSPWLSRAATLFTVLGIVGFTALFVKSAGNLAGVLPADVNTWFSPLALLNLLGLFLGYLLYGAASLRSDVGSRTFALLLMAPSLGFTANFVRGIAMGRWTPEWSPALFGGLEAVFMLAIGYTLWTGAVTRESTRDPTDAPA